MVNVGRYTIHGAYIYIYIHIKQHVTPCCSVEIGPSFVFLSLRSCLHPGTEWPKDSYGLEASPNDWRPRPTGVSSGGWRKCEGLGKVRGLLEGSFHDLDNWLITMVRFHPT